MPHSTALLLIDYQNDFVDPKGTLYVNGAEKLSPAIQNILDRADSKNILKIATQDRHPADHMSFASQHGVAPFTLINDEMKRPDHCSAQTWGADFFEVNQKKFDHIVHKAVTKDKDAYSGFLGTELHEILKKKSIKHLLVGGVATDYCVQSSVNDALKLGYEVTLLEDLIAGVNSENTKKHLSDLQSKGVKIISSKEIV